MKMDLQSGSPQQEFLQMDERQIYRVWANLHIEHPELTYEMVKARYILKNYVQVPFSEVDTGTRFFVIDDNMPKHVLEHIKLYEETEEDGWNVCELEEGRLAHFEPTSLVYVEKKGK